MNQSKPTQNRHRHRPRRNRHWNGYYITVSQMLKKLEERLNMLSTDIENIF